MILVTPPMQQLFFFAVYSVYFKQGVVSGPEGSALWGLSLTIAMLVVAVIAPFLGTIAGFAIAGVQSISQTLVSVFAPKGKATEFDGFFALAGRTSSIIGPGVMGFAAAGLSAWVMNTLVKANIVGATNETALIVIEQIGHRFVIITIVIFLLVGLMMLLYVNEDEGRAAVLRADKYEVES